MNWLLVALPLAVFYLIWFGYLLFKRNYTNALLFFALAHIPYLLINLVAPFRGIFDPNYVGYSFGWIQLPKGIFVLLVVGGIVISCFVLASKALSNKMNKSLWVYAFLFDLVLCVFAAFPVLLDVMSNISEFTVELGEYLKVSGIWVALLVFLVLVWPVGYACYLSGKNLFAPKKQMVS